LSAYALNASVCCIHSQVIKPTNLGKVVANVVHACSNMNHVSKKLHIFAAKVEHCRQSGPINLLQPRQFSNCMTNKY